MPRTPGKPLIKITTRIFEEDYEELKRFATPDYPMQEMMRDILHQFVVQSGARLRAKIDQLEKPDG